MRNYSLNFIEYGILGKYSGATCPPHKPLPKKFQFLKGRGLFCTGHTLSFLGPKWESPITGGGWVESLLHSRIFNNIPQTRSNFASQIVYHTHSRFSINRSFCQMCQNCITAENNAARKLHYIVMLFWF